MNKPTKYKGYWLWPCDGAIDVHAPTDEPCSSSVIAEGFNMRDAKRFVDYEIALHTATNNPAVIIGNIR